jgi:hypothetical protein
MLRYQTHEEDLPSYKSQHSLLARKVLLVVPPPLSIMSFASIAALYELEKPAPYKLEDPATSVAKL